MNRRQFLARVGLGGLQGHHSELGQACRPDAKAVFNLYLAPHAGFTLP